MDGADGAMRLSLKDHWDNSCFKIKTATIAKNTMPSASNFKPAHIKIERQDKNHDCLTGLTD